MPVKHQEIAGGEIQDLSLLMETAGDLVTDLIDLALAVERGLGEACDVDDIIGLLRQKKSRVDTLNSVALEITSRLKLNTPGEAGLGVPEGLKVRFRELMADFRRLLDEEARIEGLIAGRGFPVSKRLR